MPKVAILDLGIGNIKSVYNASKIYEDNVIIVENAEELYNVKPDKIILPGVGAVGEAIKEMRKRGFEKCLNDMVIKNQVNFLGICLGMQILAEECHEFGNFKGLGWIKGQVKALKKK